MTTSTWSVTATDVGTGASPVSVSGAAVRRVTWALNEPAVAEIDLRRVDSDLGQFTDPTREIQIHRDGTILFWGPVVRTEIDQDTANIQCADPAWYLTRRYFGRADRINHLNNGDFEDGITDWTATGTTAVVDPFRAVNGGKSIRLTSSSSGDNYIEQTYTHVQAHPLGDLLTIAGWVWIQSAGYEGDAGDHLGLFVERRSSDDSTLLDAAGDPGDDNPAIVNSDPTAGPITATDQWVRLETTLPYVKDGDKIHVRLYSPFGTVWWDLVTLTAMESLAFVEQDLATIIRGIVVYAQDRFPGFTHGKSDVHLDVAADPTGVTLSRAYQFADHQNVADAIAEFTTRRGGIDWAVEVTDTTRTMVVDHPHRGVTHTDLTLEWGTNISSFRWSRDRVQQATSTVILGPGDGPDREEGGAVLGSYAGPTLEDVSVAPDGTSVAELDRAADERLAVVQNPEVLEVVAVGIVGAVSIGDWLPVVIDWGDAVAVDDTYRIVRIEADPANDSLTLTLNLRDPETPEEAMARFPRAVDACLAPGGGVWVVGSDGGVGAFGGATYHGSLPGDSIIPNAPAVAIVPHGAGGYWIVCADTGCFNYGDAPSRSGITAMVDTEYPRGDRAIVAAEPTDPGGADTLTMIADDGATYTP